MPRRLETYLDLQRREVMQWISIYGSVAKEYRCPEMLSTEQIARFKEKVMRQVRCGSQALQDGNLRDFGAAGDVAPREVTAEQHRVQSTLEPQILSVVNAELRVLEAEAKAKAKAVVQSRKPTVRRLSRLSRFALNLRATSSEADLCDRSCAERPHQVWYVREPFSPTGVPDSCE
ncbi:MAG: hypothetical protein ACRD8O_04585 [Bryobacteraceae bacterium]